MHMKKLTVEQPVTGLDQRGFTLIELMVVVVVVGILAIVGYPSYTQYVVKAKRSAAESFIMSVSNKQEQYVLNARQYTTVLSDLGLSTPADVAANYTISQVVSSVPLAYSITAAPIGAQATNDTKCGSVSIDNAGVKGISGTGTVAECW
jgi:type IV pilus assembly protein PilE